MEEKIIFSQFENRIVKTPDAMIVQRRPFGMLGLGFGILVLSFVLNLISGELKTEVLSTVVYGFSFLIGILGAIFFIVGVVSFVPRVRDMLVLDFKAKQIRTGGKTYDFAKVQGVQVAPLGSSYSTLQLSLIEAPNVIRIITLPVSKLNMLEKLKTDFEQIFTASISAQSKTAPAESLNHQGFQEHKLVFVFTLTLGFLWCVICYFAFEGLYIQSRYSSGVRIPFWSLGFLIMLIGVFNFFKKKNTKL